MACGMFEMRYAYYISRKAKRKGNEMFIESNRKIVFTTRSIDDAIFVGVSQEDASEVFTNWLHENIEWLTAGSELEAIEIVGVDYDLVDFNNQVIVSYLCSGCEDKSCENEDDYHEETIHQCRFAEKIMVSEWRR
jgi:hypothetical protein